jgi:hypothetical protein
MLKSMVRGERPYLLASRFALENSRQRNSEQQNVEQGMSNVEVNCANGTLLRRSAVLLFDILRFVVA